MVTDFLDYAFGIILFYSLKHTKHTGLCARPVIWEHVKSRPLGAKITKSESARRPTAGALCNPGGRYLHGSLFGHYTHQNNGAGVPKLLLLMLTYLAGGRDAWKTRRRRNK